MSIECRVFYSWQSDLKGATNRNLIQTALENAAKTLKTDDTIQVEPVIDRDTSGVPGSPDIANTIFTKIDQAQIFVCDVSIINSGEKTRLTPNPNVLIELGYAIRALGADRVIMVMNTAFGSPEALPFDLRMRRITTYHMPADSSERAGERKKLEQTFIAALRSILNTIDFTPVQPPALSIGEQTRVAIANAQPNQALLTRDSMKWLIAELDQINPNWSSGEELDELLVQAIENTQDLILEFAQVAEIVSSMNQAELALEIYQNFEQIVNRYHLPANFSGNFREAEFEFFKFIGHELFVTFFSFFVRDQRWELIADLLDRDLYIENFLNSGRSSMVKFTYISQHLKLLQYRKQRLRANRASIHADLLNKYHSEGGLGQIVPIDQFIASDCFLFLRAELSQESEAKFPNYWMAWSSLYMERVPRFLNAMTNHKYAQRMLHPLGVDSIETLKVRFEQRKGRLERLFESSYPFYANPLSRFDVGMIASQ